MNHFQDQNQETVLDASWLSSSEGQLLVDVMETPREIIVRSAIAGVSAENIDLTLCEDTLTIRGERHEDTQETKHKIIHAQECHWGAFSRSIILPSQVDPHSVDAVLKKGVLTIRMKKMETDTDIPVLDLDDF